MKYGYNKPVSLSFDEAIQKTKDTVIKEGFSVVTEVDMQAIFKKKLDIDYDKYVMLGVCDPALAHQALGLEIEVGLLLPCSVIIYEVEGQVIISSIVPTIALSIVDTIDMVPLALKIEERLLLAIDKIE